MKVCLGGTFDYLHNGHKTLINKAFEIAGEKGFVLIGLTSDKLVKNKKNVKPLDKRKKNLQKYLETKGYNTKTEILIIEDKYGPSIEMDLDVIVVSSETVDTVNEINEIRLKKGLNTLEIVEIPLVLAEDGLPISSSRIRRKEIDEYGRII